MQCAGAALKFGNERLARPEVRISDRDARLTIVLATVSTCGLLLHCASQHRIYLDARLRGPIIIDGEGGSLGFAAMPFPRRFIPKKPPIGQRRCPACGHLMFLARIEPTDQAGRDQRTYECVECAFAETETVQFA